jgi:LPXTG-site transpeptidase (sortase) family protein
VPRQTLVDAAALVGLIVATLTCSWSDGRPDNAVVDPVAPLSRFVPARLLQFGWIGGAVGGHVGITYTIPIPTAPPATILIPKLNIHRPVEPVGLDRSGTMSVPQNVWNAGWYKYGSVPGAPGDAVIEGHAGYPTAPLLFGKLNLLRSGDQIVVVLNDGSRRLFLVNSVAVWKAGARPTGMFTSTGPPRLTLVTCTGPFDDKFKTYADRLVVEATYAGQA